MTDSYLDALTFTLRHADDDGDLHAQAADAIADLRRRLAEVERQCDETKIDWHRALADRVDAKAETRDLRRRALTPEQWAAVEAWRSLPELERDMWLSANECADGSDVVDVRVCRLLRAIGAEPAREGEG